jgi:exodeoxyribonuclease III
MKITSFNINSVRLRLPLLAQLQSELDSDVICLQEIKVSDDAFPLKDLKKLGFAHIAFSGQKGYHGVAILSKIPFVDVEKRVFCDIPESRHIALTLTEGPYEGMRIHNFYVPAGGDEPDVNINPKFAHKLAFIQEMTEWQQLQNRSETQTVLVGDLNIAPLEHDVWSSKQLTKVVSHTPIERELFQNFMEKGDWVDAPRLFTPAAEKLYTWWSYRSADWRAANKGRRLDHALVSPALKDKIESYHVHIEARGYEKPSDHVPLSIKFKG